MCMLEYFESGAGLLTNSTRVVRLFIWGGSHYECGFKVGAETGSGLSVLVGCFETVISKSVSNQMTQRQQNTQYAHASVTELLPQIIQFHPNYRKGILW